MPAPSPHSFGLLPRGFPRFDFFRGRNLADHMAMLEHPAPVVGIGALMGIVGAVIAGRLLASQLFGVSPLDPVSLLVASSLLLVIGVCAAYFPARRAVRIDPMQALRIE